MRIFGTGAELHIHNGAGWVEVREGSVEECIEIPYPPYPPPYDSDFPPSIQRSGYEVRFQAEFGRDAAYWYERVREALQQALAHRTEEEATVDPTGEYTTQVEEGVTLSPYTLEFTAWIQHCYDLLEAGQEDHILSDPWYQRPGGRPMLTDDEVDKVIAELDKEYEVELGTYPGYHRNRSGANALPEFHRLSPRARRALVEGCDRIITKYWRQGEVRQAEEVDAQGA
jgi:hypothetical protein